MVKQPDYCVAKRGGVGERMADDGSDLVDHVGVDLWFASLAYEQAMFARVAEHGFADISVTDSEILVAIPAGGARMTDVARARRVTKQAAQERIKSLIARGYLAAEPDPEDKRARRLIHTDRGHALRAALNGIKRQLHREVEDRLGREATARLRDQLRDLRARLAE